MKTYQVTITYTSEEIYTLTAEDDKEAELKALYFFRKGESGDIKAHKSTHDTPQEVTTKVVSETVDLEASTSESK